MQRALTVAVVGCFAAAGCAPVGCGGEADASVGDADATSPCGPATDGSSHCDGGAPDPALTSVSHWSTFDTTTVTPPGHPSYVGAAFDGRYVYFVPVGSVALRYDIQGSFAGGATAWSTFDVTTVNAKVSGFRGAAFDGRYIYFSPPSGVVARYDTQGVFTAGSSWSTVDLTTVGGGSGGGGALFDGRYVYFLGQNNLGATVTRYDTQAPFSAPDSWLTLDAGTANLLAMGGGGGPAFVGGVFDGRYVYLVPSGSSGLPTVVRYDTQAAFAAPSSWSSFNLVAPLPFLGGRGKMFAGGAFDGRYVYFVPNDCGSSSCPLPPVVRYDTQSAFTSACSWSTFNTSKLGGDVGHFTGAAFDGRYVYFMASSLVRYDTTGAFASDCSWSTFDTSVLQPDSGHWGAAFDGRYLYLVPQGGGVVDRFDAKNPPGLPPGPAHGSFF